jgi:hypothetical protein
MWYTGTMTRDQVKEILNRVLKRVRFFGAARATGWSCKGFATELADSNLSALALCMSTQQALPLPLPAVSDTVVINARCSLRIEVGQRVIVVAGLPIGPHLGRRKVSLFSRQSRLCQEVWICAFTPLLVLGFAFRLGRLHTVLLLPPSLYGIFILLLGSFTNGAHSRYLAPLLGFNLLVGLVVLANAVRRRRAARWSNERMKQLQLSTLTSFGDRQE